MSTFCQGCGEPITQPQGRGRPRKWCSDKCRKWTCYRGVCADCGGPTSGRMSGTAREPERCKGCSETRNVERTERILAAWNRWEPGWMIAEREGISEDNVTSIVNRQRTLGRKVILHRKPNRTDWAAIERMFQAGLKYSEIADRLDTNVGNVNQLIQSMREAGYDLPARTKYRPRTDADVDALIEMYEGGEPIGDIAERFDIRPASVYFWVYRLRRGGREIAHRPRGRKPVAA